MVKRKLIRGGNILAVIGFAAAFAGAVLLSIPLVLLALFVSAGGILMIAFSGRCRSCGCFGAARYTQPFYSPEVYRCPKCGAPIRYDDQKQPEAEHEEQDEEGGQDGETK